MKQIDIKKLKPNPDNPRVIRDDKFTKLVQSLKDFPEMSSVRPIVANAELVVLGGNMRLKAMQEAGWHKVPVEVVDWPDDKQREFIIKDNASFGEWDWEVITGKWDSKALNDWGLDVPVYEDTNLDDFFNEPAPDQDDDKPAPNIITLEYIDEDYDEVMEMINTIGGSKEQAIYKALKQCTVK